MKLREGSDTIVRGFVIIASLIIIIAGLRAAQTIVAPFFVAIFVAITLTPPVIWMTERRVPKIVAILLVVMGIAILSAGTGILVGTSIDVFTQNLPSYDQRLQNEAASLLGLAEQFGVEIPEEGVLGLIDPGAALGFAANLLSGFGNIVANAFLILLIAVFILLEVSDFPGRMRKALGRPDAKFGWFGQFADSLRRYLAIKTGVSLATGLLVGIWLWILGVDFPFLWGLLAFLLNYVPNIGSIIAAVPPFLLSTIQLGWGTSLLVAVGYLAVNMIFGNLVEPRFLGRGLGLSTLVVFLSLLFWGWVLGTVGLFLSVPLTMTAIIALKSKPETRWIAVMLGSGEEE
jgi:predicted PurR-regulated permease PerM